MKKAMIPKVIALLNEWSVHPHCTMSFIATTSIVANYWTVNQYL